MPPTSSEEPNGRPQIINPATNPDLISPEELRAILNEMSGPGFAALGKSCPVLHSVVIRLLRSGPANSGPGAGLRNLARSAEGAASSGTGLAAVKKKEVKEKKEKPNTPATRIQPSRVGRGQRVPFGAAVSAAAKKGGANEDDEMDVDVDGK